MTLSALVILAAFLGGLLRGAVEYINHGKGRMRLSRFFLVLIFLGIIGMVAGMAVYYTGLINITSMPGQLAVVLLTAYVGTDIINSLYVILMKKRIEL
jgi:hypothetical protein